MEIILSIIGITCLTSYLLKAYFESSLIPHIASKLSGKKIYTFEDYENYVIFNLPSFISSLLLCRICLAFHASYLTVLLFYICGSKFSFTEILTAIGVSAYFSSFEFKIYKKMDTQEVEVKKDPEEETKEDPKEEKKSKLKDVGGILIDYSGEKPVFVGYTDLYKSHAEKIFLEDKICDFPKCKKYKADYRKDLKKLEESFTEQGKTCPKCNISSLKRKYYDIIKAEYGKNGHAR
jgi:hypothetical protein